VNLGQELAAALPFLRQQAESRMTETVRAGVYTDGTDPVSLDPVRTLVEVLYEGPGRVKYPGNAVRNAQAAGQVVSTQDVRVDIPVQQASLLPGDDTLPGDGMVPSVLAVLFEGAGVEVLSSTADPALVGRWYRVEGAPDMGSVTAHRYPVTELS
jgi:hypothetical protein